MKKIRVMTVVGTRPEIIRISRVIDVLDKSCEHVLVHTGQNKDYELNQIFFDDLDIRTPDVFLDAAAATPSKTVANVIGRMDDVLGEREPDALLVLGDTNSCLAAYPAKRRKVPVFHMEAGNRCFDQRVPEEINRRIVDHIADINLPYSTISREYLLREGLPPDRIIKTGSPMFEVINHHIDRIRASSVLDRLGVKPRDYFLVSAHREENIDPPGSIERLAAVLNELVDDYGKRVIVSTHPRTRRAIESRQVSLSPSVMLAKPFPFTEYIRLELDAAAVLSDSGTITEESSILNFPALNIRDAHERPEGMEEGAVMMTGVDYERVKRALPVLLAQGREAKRDLRMAADYDVPNVSAKVLRIILSYTDYVNKTVWHKS